MATVNLKKWMSHLDDNLSLTQINIPATHDSTACFATFSLISRTQSLTVKGQLNAGVRMFDFRFSLENGVFYAKHGIADCKTGKGIFAKRLTADHVVADCVDFIKSNPTETILFILRNTSDNNQFFAEFFSRYIAPEKSLWYIENKIPCLSQVRGKIVLFRNVDIHSDGFDDTSSGVDFRPPYVGSTFVDDWKTGELCSVETGRPYAKVNIQDSYKVQGMKKWGTVKRFLESGLRNDEFNICTTSCTGILLPYFNAKIINKELTVFPFEKGRCYGIVMMDFVTDELCKIIISTNNDVY